MPALVARLLPFLVALLPGVAAWWSGRRLIRLAAERDPALPELLFARRQRIVLVAILVYATLIVWKAVLFYWVLPMLVVGMVMGGYALQRELHGEARGPAEYLWGELRATVGMIGFWVLLATTPAIVLSSGHLAARALPLTPWQAALVTGAPLALLLLAWLRWYPAVWLRMHAARPLEDASLVSRFAEVARRAGIAVPPVYSYAERSPVVNAVALPSLGGSRVAFSAALLRLLTPEETTAIFAHELAHLEHFDRRRLRRARMAGWVLVLLSVGLVVVWLRLEPRYSGWIPAIFPLVVVLSLAARIAKSQKHETESDLRAVALTGDAPALVRALTKLHDAALVPRRWPQDVERQASHPSLARRIQAIMHAAGAPAADDEHSAPDALTQPVVLRSTRAGAYVVLDASRAHWIEGVSFPASGEGEPPRAISLALLREHASSYHAVPYAELTELRVAVVGDGRAIVARGHDRAPRETPLDPADVALAQRALDAVDVQLAQPATSPSPLFAQLFSMAMLLAVLLTQAFTIALPALLGMWKPSAPAVAAMGTMALAASINGLARGRDSALEWTALLALAVLGALALHHAVRRMRPAERAGARAPIAGTRPILIALSAVAVLLVAAALAAASGGSSSLLGSPGVGQLAIVLLGMGTVGAMQVERRRRIGGLAIAAAAVALGAVGLEMSRRDAAPQWSAAAPPIAWSNATATPVASIPLRGFASQVELSPDGTHWAVATQPGQLDPDFSPTVVQSGAATESDEAAAEDEEGAPLDDGYSTGLRFRYAVGDTVVRRQIDAIDVAFLDDERVLVLDAQGADSLVLRMEPVGRADTVLWRLAVPTLAQPRFLVRPSDGTWTLFGRGASAELVVTTGRVGDTSRVVTRHARSDATMPLFAYSDGTALAMELRVLGNGSNATMLLVGMLFDRQPHLRTELWRVGAERSHLGTVEGVPQCGRGETSAGVVCQTRGLDRFTLITVDRSGRVLPLADLPPGTVARSLGRGSLVAAQDLSRPGAVILLDAAARRGTRVNLPAGRSSFTDVQSAAGTLAALRTSRGGATLALYRLGAGE